MKPAKHSKPAREKSVSVREGAAPVHASLWVALGLVFGLAAVYSPMFRFEFIHYDNQQFIFENIFINRGFTAAGLRWALLGVHGGYYMPLTILTHMLDCQIYGLRPWGHLLGNLLVHIANSLLLFIALRRFTGAFWRSALVAALFAFHPLRVEAVAWAVERKELLGAFFGILTLLAYCHYARGPFSLWRYSLVLLVFLLGLLSKPSVVTIPFVLLLLDFWPLRRRPVPAVSQTEGVPPGRPAPLHFLFLEKIPLLLLAAIFSCITYLSQEKDQTIQALPLLYRLEYIPLRYCAYIGRTLWPVSLSVLYPNSPDYPALWKCLSAFALLVAFSLLAASQWQRRPWLLVGWLWFLGMLVPMIGIVQNFIHSTADRFMYLPQIGLLIIIAWGIAELTSIFVLVSRNRKRTCAAVAAAVIALLMALSVHQLSFWHDDLALWSRAESISPGSSHIYSNLSSSYLDRHNIPLALKYAKLAVQISPNWSVYHRKLARDYAAAGDHAAAQAEYAQAIKLNPNDDQIYALLGEDLLAQKLNSQAAAAYQKAVELNPQNAIYQANLGMVYAFLGDYPHATEAYGHAADLDPDCKGVYFCLALLAEQQRDYDRAAQCFEKALQHEPRNPMIPYQFGLLWVNRGDPARAKPHFTSALNLAQAAGDQNLIQQIRQQLH